MLLTLMPLVSPQGWDYVFLLATPAVALLVNYEDRLPGAWRWAAGVAIAIAAFSLFDVMGRRAYATFMSLSIVTICFLVVVGALRALGRGWQPERRARERRRQRAASGSLGSPRCLESRIDDCAGTSYRAGASTSSARCDGARRRCRGCRSEPQKLRTCLDLRTIPQRGNRGAEPGPPAGRVE